MGGYLDGLLRLAVFFGVLASGAIFVGRLAKRHGLVSSIPGALGISVIVFVAVFVLIICVQKQPD